MLTSGVAPTGSDAERTLRNVFVRKAYRLDVAIVRQFFGQPQEGNVVVIRVRIIVFVEDDLVDGRHELCALRHLLVVFSGDDLKVRLDSEVISLTGIYRLL